MKKGFSSALVLGILLVVGIFGGSAYFVWDQYIQPNINLDRPSVPEADLGVDWVEYTNGRYMFTFTYPQDLVFLVDRTSDDGLNILISADKCLDTISDCGSYNSLRIKSYAAAGLSLNEWLSKYLALSNDGLIKPNIELLPSCQEKGEFEKFNFHGQEFHSYTFNYFENGICKQAREYDEGNLKTWKVAYFKKDEVVYSFDLRYSRGSVYDDTFSRILSTFEIM